MARYSVLLGLLCLFIVGCQSATVSNLDISKLNVSEIDKIVTEAFDNANKVIIKKNLDPLTTGKFSKSFSKRVLFATLKVSLEGWANITGLATLRRENFCGIKSNSNGSNVACTIQYGPVQANAYFAADLPLIGKKKVQIGLKFPQLEVGLDFQINKDGKVSIKKFQLLPFISRPEITDTHGIPSILLDFLKPVTNFLDNIVFERMNSALGSVSTILKGFIQRFLPK